MPKKMTKKEFDIQMMVLNYSFVDSKYVYSSNLFVYKKDKYVIRVYDEKGASYLTVCNTQMYLEWKKYPNYDVVLQWVIDSEGKQENGFTHTMSQSDLADAMGYVVGAGRQLGKTQLKQIDKAIRIY